MHEITGPALVLGSTQSDEIVDRAACAHAEVEVVRRRSGGGAVLLVPGQVTWVDVILPSGAPGWADDVHLPMTWLGEHLAAAFATVGLDDLAVHRGRLVTTEWSRTICFDGLGPGELSLSGAKLVGISQRRTRSAARLQACWYSVSDPDGLAALLTVDVDTAALQPVATVPREVAESVPEQLAVELSATLA